MIRKTRLDKSLDDSVFDIINTVLVIIVLIAIIYPLWFVIVASVSEPGQVLKGNVTLWPKGFQLDAYRRVLNDPKILTGYRNTIFYTFVGTLFNLFATTAIAYPLSRKDFVGRNVIMKIIVFTMFFSGGLIPTYLIYKQIEIVNTIWAMLIPGLVNVYNVILMKSFFSNIPYEMHEAAVIDGSGNMNTLVKIILPLTKPIIAVMIIFYGVAHWNEYFNALIYITSAKLKPLQLILRDILIIASNSVSEKGSGGSDFQQFERMRIAESLKYAAIIVSTLPVLCLYPFMQKHFAKGVMLGSIKG